MNEIFHIFHFSTHTIWANTFIKGEFNMMEIKYFPPASFPEEDYDDHNIPEIDMPKPTNATDVIPDEVPRRDGPGGE